MARGVRDVSRGQPPPTCCAEQSSQRGEFPPALRCNLIYVALFSFPAETLGFLESEALPGSARGGLMQPPSAEPPALGCQCQPGTLPLAPSPLEQLLLVCPSGNAASTCPTSSNCCRPGGAPQLSPNPQLHPGGVTAAAPPSAGRREAARGGGEQPPGTGTGPGPGWALVAAAAVAAVVVAAVVAAVVVAAVAVVAAGAEAAWLQPSGPVAGAETHPGAAPEGDGVQLWEKELALGRIQILEQDPSPGAGRVQILEENPDLRGESKSWEGSGSPSRVQISEEDPGTGVDPDLGEKPQSQRKTQLLGSSPLSSSSWQEDPGPRESSGEAPGLSLTPQPWGGSGGTGGLQVSPAPPAQCWEVPPEPPPHTTACQVAWQD
ncbi:uncharacterized protein [Heliangelus exortis]|uniref:uncharacterized protein n=1 Tax=Heliangelus exortis TaxID=472823 RepID=UPI003A8D1CA5